VSSKKLIHSTPRSSERKRENHQRGGREISRRQNAEQNRKKDNGGGEAGGASLQFSNSRCNVIYREWGKKVEGRDWPSRLVKRAISRRRPLGGTSYQLLVELRRGANEIAAGRIEGRDRDGRADARLRSSLPRSKEVWVGTHGRNAGELQEDGREVVEGHCIRTDLTRSLLLLVKDGSRKAKTGATTMNARRP